MNSNDFPSVYYGNDLKTKYNTGDLIIDHDGNMKLFIGGAVKWVTLSCSVEFKQPKKETAFNNAMKTVNYF